MGKQVVIQLERVRLPSKLFRAWGQPKKKVKEKNSSFKPKIKPVLNLLDLPPEILCRIMKSVPWRERLGNTSLVCKKLLPFCTDPLLTTSIDYKMIWKGSEFMKDKKFTGKTKKKILRTLKRSPYLKHLTIQGETRVQKEMKRLYPMLKIVANNCKQLRTFSLKNAGTFVHDFEPDDTTKCFLSLSQILERNPSLEILHMPNLVPTESFITTMKVQCHKLTELTLNVMEISDELLKLTLSNFQLLQKLELLEARQLTVNGMKSITRLPSLKKLKISQGDCLVNNDLIQAFSDVECMKNLTFLDIGQRLPIRF